MYVKLGSDNDGIDFKLLAGTKKPFYMQFKAPNGKVFDVEGGPKGKNLIYYSPHGGDNQNFRLVLTPDNSMFLMYNDNCFGVINSNGRYEKVTCEKDDAVALDLYYETSNLETTKQDNDDASHNQNDFDSHAKDKSLVDNDKTLEELSDDVSNDIFENYSGKGKKGGSGVTSTKRTRFFIEKSNGNP